MSARKVFVLIAVLMAALVAVGTVSAANTADTTTPAAVQAPEYGEEFDFFLGTYDWGTWTSYGNVHVYLGPNAIEITATAPGYLFTDGWYWLHHNKRAPLWLQPYVHADGSWEDTITFVVPYYWVPGVPNYQYFEAGFAFNVVPFCPPTGMECTGEVQVRSFNYEGRCVPIPGESGGGRACYQNKLPYTYPPTGFLNPPGADG